MSEWYDDYDEEDYEDEQDDEIEDEYPYGEDDEPFGEDDENPYGEDYLYGEDDNQTGYDEEIDNEDEPYGKSSKKLGKNKKKNNLSNNKKSVKNAKKGVDGVKNAGKTAGKAAKDIAGGGKKTASKAASALGTVGLVLGILKDKAKKKVKSLLNSQEINGYKKNARKVGCMPKVVGDCPFCGRISIFRSMRFGDIITNKVQGYIFKEPITTYYCMNAGCKRSYYRGYCFRADRGDVEGMGMLGKQSARKRILNIN